VAEIGADDELAFRPLYELQGLLTAKVISPVALAELFLDRIERLDPIYRAFILVTRERARAAAVAAERALQGGDGSRRLLGLPFACKDVFHVRGETTTAGSRVPDREPAAADADVIATMSAAGGVLLGKTNLHEFCYGATGENPVFGTAVNPFDRTRLAGGSSSGSAAAMAAGLAAAAFGTDTAGSVRVPAALCGLVGFKPTAGLVSASGVVPWCWSLDQVGLITRCARDADLLLGVIAAADGVARETSLCGARIGVPTAWATADVEADVAAGYGRALDLCVTEGAELVDIAMFDMEHVRTVSLVIQLAEALSYHSRYLPMRAHLYGADVISGLVQGQYLFAETYVRAQRMVQSYCSQLADLLSRVDMIVTPATPIVAPKLGATSSSWDGRDEPVGNTLTRFTTLFNLTGNPAVVLPSGTDRDGLPVGIQLIGKPFADHRLLAAADVLERGLPRLRPVL